MKIPPAIDSAMWEVVESGDSQLMDEFAARYPEQKAELAKRLTMVRSLKGSKPKSEAKPAFRPRANVEMPSSGRTWTTGTLLIALAGAALATYGSVRVYDQLTTARQPIAAPSVTGQSQSSGIQHFEPPQTDNPQTTPLPDESADKPVSQPDPAQTDPFERRISVSTQEAMLSTVLQDIATQANLVLEAMPGLPEQKIRADYVNVSARQALEDLGRNFGFTAVIEGRRHAILVPARDRNSTTGSTSPPASNPAGEPSTTGSALRGPVNPRGTGDGTLPPVGGG